MPEPKAKPGIYGEDKTSNLFCRVTPSAYRMIEDRAANLKLSRSEYVERLARWAEDHWDGQLQREIGYGQEES